MAKSSISLQFVAFMLVGLLLVGQVEIAAAQDSNNKPPTLNFCDTPGNCDLGRKVLVPGKQPVRPCRKEDQCRGGD